MSSAYVWNIGQIYTGSTEDLGQIHHAQYAEKDYKLLLLHLCLLISQSQYIRFLAALLKQLRGGGGGFFHYTSLLNRQSNLNQKKKSPSARRPTESPLSTARCIGRGASIARRARIAMTGLMVSKKTTREATGDNIA